jgi:hypothetical protein
MPQVVHIDGGKRELRDLSHEAWAAIQRDATLVPSPPLLSTTCPICGAHMTKGRHLASCKNNLERP